MTEFARELEQTFVRFDAAVGEKALARPDEINERLRQPPLRFMVIEVRRVDDLAGLLDERLGDGRMRVAERAHRDATAQIEIALSVHVEEITARAVTERDVEAAIARHDVFTEQLADRLELVADNRRR